MHKPGRSRFFRRIIGMRPTVLSLLFRQKSVPPPPHLSVRRQQSVLVLPGELHYLISVDGGSVTHLLDEPSVRVPQSAGWSASINDFNPLLGPMSSC